VRAADVQLLLAQGTEPLLKALRIAGARMSYQRALRCVKDGIGGIRLAAVRIGGRWHTSPEAVREFIAQTTRGALRRDDTEPPRPNGIGARYLRSLGLDRGSLMEARNRMPASQSRSQHLKSGEPPA
jgi:hypothetical protein